MEPWHSTDINDSRYCPDDGADGNTSTSYVGYYLNGPPLTCVILLGVVGNLLSLFPLCKPTHAPQINQHLIALCMWDLTLVVSSFFVYNLPQLLYGNAVSTGPYVRLYPLSYALSCASHMGSIWMVMASAVDRYFALCQPWKHRLYCSRARTKAVLAACSLLCLLYNAPRYLEVRLSVCYDLQQRMWTPTVSSSGLRENAVYWHLYKICGGLVLFSVAPFAALTFLNVRVYCEVKRLTGVRLKRNAANAKRLRTPRAVLSGAGRLDSAVLQSEQRNRLEHATLRRHSVLSHRQSSEEAEYCFNFMLMSVVLKFLICHLLPTVLDVWESASKAEFDGSLLIDCLVDISNFLVVTNSSVNIFIYLWSSRRFRRDLAVALFRLCPCLPSRCFSSVHVVDASHSSTFNSVNNNVYRQCGTLTTNASRLTVISTKTARLLGND